MPKPSFRPESQKITPSNASNDWRLSNYFNYMFRFVEAWPLNDRGEALHPRGGDHANGSAGDPPGGHACPSPSTPFTLLKKSGEFELAIDSENEEPNKCKAKSKRHVTNESRISAASKKYLGSLLREQHAEFTKNPQGNSCYKGWEPQRIVDHERKLYGQLVRRGVVSGLVVDGCAANLLQDDLANRYMAWVAHHRANLLDAPTRKRTKSG